MAALAAVLPVNVWIYAGQLQNLRSVGRKFVLQGGTHRNIAVVKAQVDFIRGKVPEAEVVLHPYSGEAGGTGDPPRPAGPGQGPGGRAGAPRAPSAPPSGGPAGEGPRGAGRAPAAPRRSRR